MQRILLIIAVFFMICSFSPDKANGTKSIEPENPRVQWMKGKYGIMVHWVADLIPQQDGINITEWDRAVNNFDLEGFMADFEKTGAEWLIFTINHSQNRGLYASPNSIIDSLAGTGHTSRRDLVLEIARALKKRGKKFIGYLPIGISGPVMRKGFGWNTKPGTNQSEFQEKYLLAIREWAIRYGENLDGWWFDGCYESEPFHNKHMKWEQWFETCRAGNKNAVLAFNDGAFTRSSIKPIVPGYDYLSGEAVVLIDGKIRVGNDDNNNLFMPETAYVKNTQCLNHVLLPVDVFWWHGVSDFPDWAKSPVSIKKPAQANQMESPLYPDRELQKFVHEYTKVGGAVTLNVGIFSDGHLGKETVKQLRKLKKSF